MLFRFASLLFLSLLLYSRGISQTYSVDWGYDLFQDQLPNGILIDTAYGNLTYTNAGDSLFLQTFAETRCVVTDQQNNSISLSEYQGTYFSFSSFTTENLLPNGIVLTKRDASGNQLWNKFMKGGGTPIGWSAATDASNNIWVCGDYNDTLDVDPDPAIDSIIYSNGGFAKNGFVAKLDPNGQLLQGFNFTSTDEFTCYDMALDGANNIYLVGEFEGTADFNPGTGIASATSTGSAENLFVVKLDAQGNYLWHHVSQTSNFSRAYKCAVDDQSAVYIVGEFSDQVDFSGSGQFTQTSNGSFDAFIFKLDSTGQYEWARSYGTTALENIRAIHFDGQHVVVAGYFEGTLNLDPNASNFSVSTNQFFNTYVQKLDPQGNHIWANEVGDGAIRIRDIESDELGSIILAGSLFATGTFNLPGGPFTIMGQDLDMLAVMIDSNNTTIWAKGWSSPDDDWLNSLSVMPNGEWAFAGTFQEELYLNGHSANLVYGEGSGYEGLTFNMSKCRVSTHISTTACNSYASPSGRYTWNTSGAYRDTVRVSGDCDSIFTVDLTIGNSPLTSITASACDSYQSPGGQVYTVTGLYQDTLQNALACDSIIAIDLTINSTPDTSVVQMGDSLVAVGLAADYQWLSCDSVFQPIQGATTSEYVVTQSGSYAVQISNNGCVDTSTCREVLINGITELSDFNLFIYPNPVIGSSVIVDGVAHQKNYPARLADPLGRLLWEGTLYHGQSLAIPPTPGVYLLIVQMDAGPMQTFKIVR